MPAFLGMLCGNFRKVYRNDSADGRKEDRAWPRSNGITVYNHDSRYRNARYLFRYRIKPIELLTYKKLLEVTLKELSVF